MAWIRFALALTCTAVAGLAAADDAKGEKVEYTLHDGQFEKNTSGLKGDVSFLSISDRDAFDKMFGVAFTMGKKPNVVPKDAFEKKLAAAVITRGNAVTTYTVEKVTSEGTTLYLQYKTTTGPVASARFASPLIVTVDKGSIKKVVFIADGKTAGTAEVK